MIITATYILILLITKVQLIIHNINIAIILEIADINPRKYYITMVVVSS